MESSLTDLEIDAVFQLIQLSAASSAADFRVFWVNFPPPDKDEQVEEEGSAGEALSSFSSIAEDKCSDDEALPRRKAKYGSLVHIYTKTRPLINNRPKKRARF
ncbi:hypothetical protein Salat_0159400 [Sesamum alatum]|uniref:Uncharacterized protein n=1 Tax=Sesamum alatum TaxID=300844 RepID=A0AAE1YXU0_9LAMI|nr:hypothetical protein Salat_0159400 [Sesamum alatum]